AHRFQVAVHVDSQNGERLVLVLLHKLAVVFVHLAARRTSVEPEVDQNNLAPVVTELDRLALRVDAADLGRSRSLADGCYRGRRHLAAAEREAKEGHQDETAQPIHVLKSPEIGPRRSSPFCNPNRWRCSRHRGTRGAAALLEAPRTV